MVLTITMVMVGRPKIVSDAVPGLSDGPFCAVVRAEREYGNEKLPGAPQGSLCAVDHAGRGG
eukprot:15440668-Alexandrium_andersonii.AAC.1